MKHQVYFPGLNAIRFYAAFSVLIYHISNFPYQWFGTPIRTNPINMLFFNGWDGVTVFFVLSGFLITYLLLTEMTTTGTISLRKFYTRRALRIWPLYYLLIVISIIILILVVANPFVITTGENLVALAMFLFFIPNVAVAFFSPLIPSVVALISHIWSIGVEEQFYFVWPFLIRKPWRFIKRFLIIFFSIKWTLSTFLYILFVGHGQDNFVLQLLNFLDHARFECIAIGAAGAYILFTNHRYLQIIYRPSVDRLAIVLTAGIILFSDARSTWYDLFLAVLTIICILNIGTNPKAILKLENKWLHELGLISYGIYIYHPIIMFLFILLLQYMGITHSNGWLYDLPLYSLTSIVTIGVAFVSYQYFEKPFLRIKERFSIWHKVSETHTSSPVL